MNKQLIIVVAVIEYEGKFLLTRRVSSHALWDKKFNFPGGKIDAGERPEEALHREIFEETGLSILSPALLGVYTHFWPIKDGIQQTLVLLYHAKSITSTVSLKLDENDTYIWEHPENILQRDDLLDGMKEMITQYCLKKESIVVC